MRVKVGEMSGLRVRVMKYFCKKFYVFDITKGKEALDEKNSDVFT